jgi:putative membrane protein (TIGR04086 family)
MKWGRILLAAVFAEVVLFGIAIAFYALGRGDALLYVIPPASLAATMLFGFWAARAAPSRLVLHGLLVGVIAALAYVAMTWGKPLPMAYLVSHFLKVIGGTLGGVIAQRRRR